MPTKEEINICFDHYVKSYLEILKDNKTIHVKYKHSYRVASLCEEILKRMNLTEENILLGYFIGLFHDIARFEEAKLFKKLSNKNHFDHGKEGAEIVKRNHYFKMPSYTHKIIYDAILNHNKFNISPDLSASSRFFAKLIRDADKIDIYRVIYENYHDEYFDQPITDKVGELFLNHQPLKHEYIKTNSDKVLERLAFIFDLNYDESFDLLRENKNFTNYLSSVKVDSKYQNVFANLKEFSLSYLERK